MTVQKWVEIRHPDVDATAVVAAVSLPHHRKAGWEVVESTEAPPAQPQAAERPPARSRLIQPEKHTESEGTS